MLHLLMLHLLIFKQQKTVVMRIKFNNNYQLTQSLHFLPWANEWDQQLRVVFIRCGTSDTKCTHLGSLL